MAKTFPLSTKNIREIVGKIRRIFGLKNTCAVNITQLYDILSIIEFSSFSFSYCIVPDDSKLLGKREEARTIVNTGEIFIKQWVWNDACIKKRCRAIFTLAHELGHFFLAALFGLPLSRVNDDTKVRPFEDPEWQANTFASEFLMPFEECIDKTPDEISETYNVSKKCAETRKAKIIKEISNKK